VAIWGECVAKLVSSMAKNSKSLAIRGQTVATFMVSVAIRNIIVCG